MELKIKSSEPEDRKRKWLIPLIITFIILILFDLEISGELLFLGFYIMMVYNILYYRKISKRPMLELLLVQPFGILAIALLLPPHLYDLLLAPTIFFVFGSMFAMMAFFYLRQESGKRRRCSVLTVATVINNQKKRTTSDSDSYSYSPVVQYYAGGEQREVTYDDGLPSPIRKGKKVEILYNHNNPEEFCFADKKQVRSLNIMGVVFLLLGLAAILISGFVLLERLFVF